MAKKHKNPQARKAAAKKLLSMSMKKKALSKEAIAGNGTANKQMVPQNNAQMDSGNPGQDMK